MCHGAPCELPGCSYRPGGGVGLKKSRPSTIGRTPRERAYMAAHRICEACKAAPSTECHHVGGRGGGGWRRDSADLQALCMDCHGALSGQHSTGRR